MQLGETFVFKPAAAPAGVTLELRPLTMPEAAAFRKVMAKHGVDSVEAYECLLAAGLCGWTGVVDRNGTAEPCNVKTAMRLPNAIIEQAAQAIFAATFLTVEEKKTSSSRPRSTPTAATSTAPAASGAGTATKRTRRRSGSGK